MKRLEILRAIRPFSLTTNFLPFALLLLIALYSHNAISWHLAILTIISVLFIQAGCNIFNEYYDFTNDLDPQDPLKYDRPLVQKTIAPQTLKKAGLIFFALALLTSIPLIYERVIIVAIIGAVGLIGGYTYTGKNWGYKYLGLGDIFVFILMGPLMVIGMYLGITGAINSTVIWISLPVGFLISAILQSNNIRDIEYDRASHIKTLAIYIGKSNAIKLYASMFIGSYLVIISMIFFHLLPLTCLISILTIPFAYKLIRTILYPANLVALKSIDEETAKVFTMIIFSLCIGMILGVKYAM